MIRGGTRSPSSMTAIDSSSRIDRQPRHERDAHARGDERLQRAVVVRAEHDVRLSAGHAQPLLDTRSRAARAVADERQFEDLAERRRLLALGRGRVGGDDEHVRIAHQLDRLEWAALERKHAEADVDLATLDELEQLAVVGRLDEPDVHLRPFGAEVAEERGEDARADGLVRADAERPGVAVTERSRGRPAQLPGAR